MKLNETQKQYPIEISEYYSPGLNSLKRIYTQHPKFKGNTRLIYELLFDYWNSDYGYAFPTHWDLARDSGMSRRSIVDQIKVLEELDLIEVRKSPVGDRKNNVYIIKSPVTTIEEFYEKFPEVKDQAQERIRKLDAEEAELQKKWAKDKSAGKEYTKVKEPETVTEREPIDGVEAVEPPENTIEETSPNDSQQVEVKPPETVESISPEAVTPPDEVDEVDIEWF